MNMSNEQNKDLTAKQLPCGGYAIFGFDAKTKAIFFSCYIGANLPLEGYFQGIKVEK